MTVLSLKAGTIIVTPVGDKEVHTIVDISDETKEELNDKRHGCFTEIKLDDVNGNFTKSGTFSIDEVTYSNCGRHAAVLIDDA